MPSDRQAVLEALASPIRREILWLTRDRELSAGEIGAHFERSAATISNHLGILRSSGLLDLRVDGNFRRYRCRDDAVSEFTALLDRDDREWRNADDLPEAGHAASAAMRAVIVSVDLPIDPSRAFTAFTDEREYTRWLGVPVSIDRGRFRATMEWGMEVRGTYDIICPPNLIAMRWDFDDERVPLPGRELVAYLRIDPTATGSRVAIHQLAPDDRRAAFLARVWSVVLGRLVEYSTRDQPPRQRSRRPKTTSPATGQRRGRPARETPTST